MGLAKSNILKHFSSETLDMLITNLLISIISSHFIIIHPLYPPIVVYIITKSMHAL